MVISAGVKRPLKFHSFEELKNQDLFEPGTSMRLKSLDINRVVSSIQAVYDKAKLCNRNGEHEDAFLLYKRVGHMCDMTLKRRDFDQIKNLPGGRLIYAMFNDSLQIMTELYDNLKALYDEQTNGTLSRSSSRMSTASKPVEELDFDFGTYIKPKELVRFINSKKSVLVIDYRNVRDEQLCFPDISVAQVPVNVLNPGCIFAGLVKTVPIAERGKLNRLSDYDLVVLMDVENPPTYRSGELYSESTALILMNALTTYNTISRPKRRPLFLEGGFENWKLHYPMYITAETQRRYSFYDQDIQFAKLLDQLRPDILPKVEYPDLYDVKPTFFLDDRLPEKPNMPQPVPRKSITLSASETKMYPPPMPIYPRPPSPNQYFNSKPDTSIYSSQTSLQQPRNSYSVTEFPPEPKAEPKVHHVPIKVMPPLPDRSTKPLRPPSPIKTEPMLPKTELTKIDKPLPRVPSLQGGARKDFLASDSTRKLERPPTPDRSIKKNVISPNAANLIREVYENCYAEFQRHSRMGKVRPGHTGLFNLGNTCFMNTTLQALFNTPQLREIFTYANFYKYLNDLNSKGTKGVMSACFSALMDCIWSGEFVAIRPDRFLNVFASEVCADLADKRQHDAQEFQIYFLNALHEDTNKVTKPEPFEQNYDGHDLRKNAEDYKLRQNRFASSPVNDVFNLRTVSQLSCSICRTTSVTFEEMNQISVELPQGSSYTRLNECLAKHFSDITLAGQNCWNCPKCKKPQMANRNTKIWELPPVLVIHLKRFSLCGGTFVKNEIHVDFEANNWMHMDPYLHGKALKQKSQYTLYAITNHDGTLNSGHYTSFIRNRSTQEWLKFDDEYCSPISPDSLVSKKAFILYYTNQNFFTGQHQLL